MNDRLLGMLGLSIRAGKTVFGVFLTEKAIDEGKAKLVIASEDIGSSNRRKISAKCENEKVDLIFYSTTEEISHWAGKKNVPVVCVCDEGFAAAIVKIYGGARK